jgi:hypothetical protein
MPDNPPPPTLEQFAAYQRVRKYRQAWGKRLPRPATTKSRPPEITILKKVLK